jgi:cytochrome d ubiquinol oxidase subunit II
MDTLWFLLTAVMIATYVVLDGFDIGAGILHRFVARSEAERAQVLQTIGPVWDGNEVWLLAGGGTLVLAFPGVYATAFAGFYLPLMLVLWLLIGRACAIELRHQVHHPMWLAFWDSIFAVSSVLLAICFGAALGNVVRGVPLDAQGNFFEPLWTDFSTEGQVGVLDWYTVLVGVAALASLAAHGARWLAMRCEGAVQQRARRLGAALVPIVGLLVALLTVATLKVQPHIGERLEAHPWLVAFPLLALGGLGGQWLYGRRGADGRAFLASCAFLVGMLLSAALGLYPYVLPSNLDPVQGLTAAQALSPRSSVTTALWWWIPGLAIAVAYQVLVYRLFRGKVRLGEGGY